MADEEDDHEQVETVAREIIDRHGDKAELWVREQADIADGHGDTFSAETWREIADAINRLLN